MEDQKSSTKQIMLNYGLMLGFISILISVANYAVGNIYEPHWAVSVVSILITIAVIVLGIKKVKELNSGYLTLGEALKTGLGIALVSGILFIIYFFVFTNFIETEFYVRSLEVKEQAILESYPNLTDEQLEGAMGMQKKLNGPLFTSAILLIVSLFFGFIIALIGGLIMKKVKEED
jgi:hypothetical protein